MGRSRDKVRSSAHERVSRTVAPLRGTTARTVASFLVVWVQCKEAATETPFAAGDWRVVLRDIFPG